MTALAANAPDGIAFGPFLLYPDRQLLFRQGVPVRIGQRALAILSVLIEQPGAVVGKRQLMAAVWPRVLVGEGNLKVNIAALRRALGEDVEEPRYVATVVGRGYRFILPVHRVGFRQPANLPPRSKPIFGRDVAIAAILAELADTRLLSIVGPGGIGKTTVALAVAQEAREGFEHGVWLVDLSSITDPALVEHAVAAALGPPDGPTALLSYLRDKNILVVLDNAEHLIAAVANCADTLLAGTTQLRLLVTSREPLCIKGERVRRLTGLSVPPASLLAVDEVLQFAAVQLFVDRALARYPAFALTDGTAATVGEICRRLDGLALAIERLAMRSGTLEIPRMLDHLNHRFHMLDGYHEGPERHRTLTAAIAWSYGLLSEGERAVMRRLAIFEGAFSLEAAGAVGADAGTDPRTVVEHVATLAAKSLILATPQQGAMQYQLTNIARAFALDQLLASDGIEPVRAAQATHLRRLAEQTSEQDKERYA